MYPNLPYPNNIVDPFDTILASDSNSHDANIKSLADGTGFNAGAITSDKIDWATTLTDPNYDSGWISATFQNGYSAQNSQAVGYRLRGGILYLRGQPGKTTLDNNVMFTLPPGYRPTQTVIGVGAGTSTNTGKIQILTSSGDVNLATPPAASGYCAIDGISFTVS